MLGEWWRAKDPPRRKWFPKLEEWTLIRLGTLALAAYDAVLMARNWGTSESAGDWVYIPLYVLTALACAWYTGSLVGGPNRHGVPCYLPGWAVRLIGWLMLLIWPILSWSS